jgi:hypothetical protein
MTNDEVTSARITELLKANNREVNKRREIERQLERMTIAYNALLDCLHRLDVKITVLLERLGING